MAAMRRCSRRCDLPGMAGSLSDGKLPAAARLLRLFGLAKSSVWRFYAKSSVAYELCCAVGGEIKAGRHHSMGADRTKKECKDEKSTHRLRHRRPGRLHGRTARSRIGSIGS